MQISASFLSIKENVKQNVEVLDKCDIDYLHLDVMDGIFVENKTYTKDEFASIIANTEKPLDVHLMVSDVKKYIDEFSLLNPDFITFHIEAVSDVAGVIKYMKDKHLKIGVSIKPATDISEIIDILPYIDLVLVMSVEPGKGGQKFIESSKEKIEDLYKIREEMKYNYLIEVDGGITDETIKLVEKCDIAVVGSYITNNNYEEAIKKIKI